MDTAEARGHIERFTAWDQVPALTAEEVDTLLAMAAVEPVWTAESTIAAGTVVRPGVENAHRYRAFADGTTGDVEPLWPVGPGSEVVSGDVLFLEAGPTTFDVYGAAAVGWEWKAAKVAGAYDFGRGEQTWSRSQMHRHCLAQAAYYRGLSSGHVASLGGGAASGSRRYGTITVAPPRRGRGAYRMTEAERDALPG